MGSLPQRPTPEVALETLANLHAAERKVYSQNGEDGVLQALFAAVGVTNRYFVEFGAEYATECNTAYLIEQGWTGLLMDAEGVSRNPQATVRRETVTAENVNDLFAKYGVPREFDLLSIDIDGNDYWVWKALEYRPRVLVIEYNAAVPPELRRTIAYDPRFCWNGTDYMGASLGALADLGNRKGYELVYCESVGSNAFFVARRELPEGYCSRPIAEIYRKPNYLNAGLRHPPDPYRILLDPEGDSALDSGRRAQQTGNPALAETLFRQALEADPDNVDALYALGQLHSQLGNASAAVPLLQRALALRPSEPTYHGALGRALGLQGQPAEAAASYERALQLNPNDSLVLKELGLAYQELGRLPQAAECFLRVLGLDTDQVSVTIYLGHVFLRMGQLDNAHHYFQEALRLSPGQARCHNNLGITLAMQGKPDDAIASFHQALRLDPGLVEASTNLALTLQRQGRVDEAEECCRLALRRSPNNAAVLRLLDTLRPK